MSEFSAFIAEDALLAIGATAESLFNTLDHDGVFGFVSDYDRPKRIEYIRDSLRDIILKMAEPEVRDWL